jgi:hypothetical protein
VKRKGGLIGRLRFQPGSWIYRPVRLSVLFGLIANLLGVGLVLTGLALFDVPLEPLEVAMSSTPFLPGGEPKVPRSDCEHWD